MSQFNDPVPNISNILFCDGHGDANGDHCCYLAERGVCPHLVINENAQLPDRKYSCGLYNELGSWSAVYQDSRYQQDVQPFFDDQQTRLGNEWRNLGCGDWPTRRMINKAWDLYQNGDVGAATCFCCYSRKAKEQLDAGA